MDRIRGDLYGTVWNRNADAFISGCRFQTRISAACSRCPVGGVLCEYDDCVVLCNGAGEAMGGNDWVHRKTIQKAIESYRITDEQKVYLKTLR